jgi:DNA-binding MarR family transcriptional regulator
METSPYASAFLPVFAGEQAMREITGETDFPMRFNQFFLLISMKPGLSAKVLAEQVGATPHAASMILGKLERNYNLVVAHVGKEDRRQRMYHLSPKGKKVADFVLNRIRNAI